MLGQHYPAETVLRSRRAANCVLRVVPQDHGTNHRCESHSIKTEMVLRRLKRMLRIVNHYG